MALYHVYSQTVADGTATSVVRPSDWNSAHSQLVTLSGNTAGASTASGTNFVFQGGNNITASVNQGANAATIVFSGANTVAQSTQTQPAGNIVGAGFTSTTTAGTAVVATQNSNGLSLGIPAFITTFQNDLTSGRAGTGFTSTTTGGTAVVGTLNTNGLSLGVPTIVTNALTTARASNDGVGLNTAGTNVTWTVNSAGISLNAGAYLTTAANSTHSHGNPTLALTNITGTTASASNGLTLSLSGVAAQTTQTQAAGNIAGVGTTFAGTNVSATVGLNSNGLNLALSAPDPGGGGGTQSLYAVSNTTQSSSGTYTNGLSFAGAGIASVGISNGSVVVSVPVGGGAGDGYNIVSMGSSGNTTGTAWSSLSASLGIYGGNNITVSQNNSNQIVISAPSGGGIGVSNLGNTFGSTGAVSDRVVFAGGAGVNLSQSTNGQSATITIQHDPHNDYMPYLGRVVAVQQIGQNTIQIQPMGDVPYISFDRLAYGVQLSAGSNSTGTMTCTVQMGIYTKNASSLSLLTSHSGSFPITYSGTNNTTSYAGLRYATMTLNGAGTMEGDVWIAFRSSTATAGTNATMSNIVVSALNSTWSGYMGVNTNATNQSAMGMGVYTATASVMPDAIAFSQINGNSSAFQRPQVFMLTNGAFV